MVGWECGTRRTLVAPMAVLVLTAIMLALPESALALPSEVPEGIMGRREDLSGRSPGTPLPLPIAPESVHMRRLSSKACADHTRVTLATPLCDLQGEVTPILIGVESVT